jgi:hypothetical protein
METRSQGVCIYTDGASLLRGDRARQIFTLALGLGLSAWYVKDIAQSIRHDVKAFPPAFTSSPVLTLLFSLIKLCAYVLFPCVFLLMIYIPVRNLFLNRVIEGTLISAVREETDTGLACLRLQVGPHKVHVDDQQRIRFGAKDLYVRDFNKLCAALNQESMRKCEVRIKLGAFARILSVESIANCN